MGWVTIEKDGARQIVQGEIVTPDEGPAYVGGHEGWTIGEGGEERPVDPGEIDVIEADLHAMIDRQAGEVRCQFITDVPGQQAAYLDKERQARAFLAGEGEAADLGRIIAEAAARGISETAMAQMIVETADHWRAIDTAIEAARIGAKIAVSAGETAAAKRAAAVVDWTAVTAAVAEDPRNPEWPEMPE